MSAVLLTLIACFLGVAAALFVLMFRRDQGIHGLVGLTLATCAGFMALIYAGVADD